MGLPKFGTGHAVTAKIWDGTRDKTGQSRKGCSKTGKRCFKGENVVLKQKKDVLKQEKDVQKQEICSFILSRDVQGQRSLSRDICSCPCPGTKGHRDKNFLLSRDKGTMGRPVPWKPYFKLILACFKSYKGAILQFYYFTR